MHLMSWLKSRKIEIILFLLFIVANAAYLHRVPGLLGDEGSEGENVYLWHQALRDKQAGEHINSIVFVLGERSYIGPLPDYVRIPFVAAFGYTALALRLPILIISLLTFWLALQVFTTSFGNQAGLLAATAMLFSPVYLTYQRLGWAITVLPFFALLLIWLLQGRVRHKALLVGLIAGLGLHIHILFLPTLVAIVVTAIISWKVQKLSTMWQQKTPFLTGVRQMLQESLTWWPAPVGFMAGFGTQLVALLQQTEDQGDPSAVAEAVSERFAALPDLLPLLISGSSFIARYTGQEFAPGVIVAATCLLGVLVIFALLMGKSKKAAWLLLFGLALHLVILMYMIDRFTLRYFVVFVLGVWALSGVGLWQIIRRGIGFFSSGLRQNGAGQRLAEVGSVVLSGLLVLVSAAFILLPFLQTGGSVNTFSLGNRTNSAADLVDTGSLLHCLRGAGTVTSENVHIFNRLQFYSHEYSDLEVVPDTALADALYLVHYRLPAQAVPAEQELCPKLAHFIVARQQE